MLFADHAKNEKVVKAKRERRVEISALVSRRACEEYGPKRRLVAPRRRSRRA
jgi:hypothetical protein